MTHSTKLLLMSLLALIMCMQSQARAQDVKVANETTIYLVRHAEKELDQGDDPHLTELGKRRAVLWAQVLKHVDLDAVYSTQTIRTQATALPIADAQQLKVQNYEAMPNNVADFASANIGKKIVMVGHSNTVPHWVNAFLGEDAYSDLSEDDYSNLFIVTLSNNAKSAQRLYVPLSQPE